MAGYSVQGKNINDYCSDTDDVLHWKGRDSLYSSDSDSGYKKSEEPQSSVLDTDSLSSCNFSKCEKTLSESSKIDENNISNHRHETTNFHSKQTSGGHLEQLSQNYDHLKSSIHGVNHLDEFGDCIKNRNDNHWTMDPNKTKSTKWFPYSFSSRRIPAKAAQHSDQMPNYDTASKLYKYSNHKLIKPATNKLQSSHSNAPKNEFGKTYRKSFLAKSFCVNISVTSTPKGKSW